MKLDKRYSDQQEERVTADSTDRMKEEEKRWEGRIEPLTNRNGQTKEFAPENLYAQKHNARDEF